MRALLVWGTLVVLGSASAQDLLQPTTLEGDFQLEMALGCASTDTQAPQYYWWTGQVYGRRAGEPDRHLFNVQGVNPRACRFVDDPARGGRGYQSAARELMLYLDPETDAVLETWTNPWTDEEVRVIQMQNDPASMAQPRFPLDAQGIPVAPRMRWESAGSSYIAGRTSNFFRDSPLGGDYQDYVGGKYQVMEISAFTVAAADVAAWQGSGLLPYTAVWTRISDWLPWMRMRGREGHTVLVSRGRSTMDFSSLPEPLRSEIMHRYPMMRETPAFDDPRPFQTSWDAIRQALDAQETQAP